MKSRYEYDKQRLQKYLPQLRGCAGLSAEALGKKLGITKQAVNAMEKHLDKPLSKMQYICIRTVFDEECAKNPNNLNLRDCYDLVFSDPDFYKNNIARVEYALHQAVEDTKIQKRKNRAEAKKKSENNKKGPSLAGTTAMTIGIGGIAAATFPLSFSVSGATIGATTIGTVASKKKIKKKHDEQMLPRASNEIKSKAWLSEVFDERIDN